MAGFWDDEDVRAAARSNGYASLLSVGDEVGGKIIKLARRVFNEGTADERTAIEGVFDTGLTLTAGQVLLKRALYELRPAVGDELLVRLVDIERIGDRTRKRFYVELTRAEDGRREVVDQTGGLTH